MTLTNQKLNRGEVAARNKSNLPNAEAQQKAKEADFTKQKQLTLSKA
jgi:hypothetical protein